MSRRRIDRRNFVKSSAAVGLAGAAGCLGGDGGGGGGPSEINIGYIPITDAAPLLVGHAKDFFEEEGFESNVTLIRGWATLAESFQAGDVNVAHFLYPMTYWMRYGLGYPAKVMAWDHTDGSGVTVAGDVSDWSDLGGETFAVPFWYSTHNVILQLILRDKEINPILEGEPNDDQVKLIVMAPPDMPPALGNGDIKGYVVAEPFCALGELNTDGKMLRFTGDVWYKHADCVLTINENDLNSNPEWAQAVVRGTVRAQRWLNNNKSEAANLLSNEGEGLLPQPREPLERVFTSYDPEDYPQAIQNPDWDNDRVGFYPYPYKSYTRQIYSETKKTKVEGDSAFLEETATDTVVNELFNYELVRSAIESVGGSTEFGIPEERAYEREERVEL